MCPQNCISIRLVEVTERPPECLRLYSPCTPKRVIQIGNQKEDESNRTCQGYGHESVREEGHKESLSR